MENTLITEYLAEQANTVLIGMSGGVDSSVAAYLMQQKGYRCIGATMRLFDNTILGQGQESTCCSLDDAGDAPLCIQLPAGF